MKRGKFSLVVFSFFIAALFTFGIAGMVIASHDIVVVEPTEAICNAEDTSVDFTSADCILFPVLSEGNSVPHRAVESKVFVWDVALAQNFPNPFNAMQDIPSARFGLVETIRVTEISADQNRRLTPESSAVDIREGYEVAECNSLGQRIIVMAVKNDLGDNVQVVLSQNYFPNSFNAKFGEVFSAAIINNLGILNAMFVPVPESVEVMDCDQMMVTTKETTFHKDLVESANTFEMGNGATAITEDGGVMFHKALVFNLIISEILSPEEAGYEDVRTFGVATNTGLYGQNFFSLHALGTITKVMNGCIVESSLYVGGMYDSKIEVKIVAG